MTEAFNHPRLKYTRFHGMITVAPQMRSFFELLTRVSRSLAPVLVRGETGTGKELVAKAIHELSERKDGPFRAINCATLTPELLASELFGHVRGAFTGAVRDRKGLFALAHKGTVFLDEIAEIPMEIQARLLRVLQEQAFVPVGGTDPIHVDVRIVSATHRALREEVAAKRFREDLMYRIRVVPLFLPRLADRDGDVEALLWHFVDEFNQRGGRVVETISAEAMELMERYNWPGNVRELRNVIEYAYAVGLGPEFSPSDLTPEIKGEPPPGIGEPRTELELEREMLMNALREARGNKGKAAELMGVSRSTLWRKLREHHISK